MSYSITEPSSRQKWIAGVLVVAYAVLTLLPLVWIIATGFKTPSDAIAYPPKVLFSPVAGRLCEPVHRRAPGSTPRTWPPWAPPTTWYDAIVRQYDMVITGPSRYGERFLNSVIIGFGSTFLSRVSGHHRRLCVQPLQGAAQG